MIFISAGHHFQQPKPDPGAVWTHDKIEYKEAEIVRDIRDLVCEELKAMNVPYICDADDETLAQYLKRIQPGSGSVVCEFHVNSAERMATGTEVIVRNNATKAEMDLARALCNVAASTFNLFNRGVKTEKESHRGRLAVLNDGAGISVLPELFFLNNPDDVKKFFHPGLRQLYAYKVAKLLAEYERMYS